LINQDFIDAINSGRIWAFVGSGPSTDAGLKSWGSGTLGLLRCIPDPAHVSQLETNPRWLASTRARDWPRALQVAEDIVGRARLLEAFADALGLNRTRGVGGIYPLIARWPFRNLVTTNYESLLFDAVRSVDPSMAMVDNNPANLSMLTRDPENLVVRLHGDLRPGTTTLLTERDYD
jgi:hypothetical protein